MRLSTPHAAGSIRGSAPRLGLAAVFAAALAMGACTQNPEDDSSTSSDPTSDATSEAPTADQAAVEAAYGAYWDAYIADAADVDTDFAALNAATYPPLRSDLILWLDERHADGHIYSGTPEWTINSVTVDLESTPPGATIEVCLDTTDWNLVDADTGEAVEVPEQSKRYPATARAEQIDGRWYIAEEQARRDESC